MHPTKAELFQAACELYDQANRVSLATEAGAREALGLCQMALAHLQDAGEQTRNGREGKALQEDILALNHVAREQLTRARAIRRENPWSILGIDGVL